MSDDVERMIAAFDVQIQSKPDYPYHLVGIAETVAATKKRGRAADIARQAMALGRDDPATMMRGRQLLASLIPGYHVPMMNDARRNHAWDAALRRAIRPGMLVLEIGTGAGMLALMAARAGAHVVTCESHPVVAGMARELAERNGYADRIKVVTKRSQDLVLGKVLERPADLLICDIFADRLLDFDPLGAIADARQRLLGRGAPVVPMAASLWAALAQWGDYRRVGHIDSACGFDLGPMADFVGTAISRTVDAPDIDLLSAGDEVFRFDFAQHHFPLAERHTLPCRVETTGRADTIVRWIRLELDQQTVLEARPERGGIFFSRPTLTPLAEPIDVRAGETITLGARHDGRTITTWFEGKAGERA